MSQHSHSGSSSGIPLPSPNANISADITKLGYLRKLKTMKKKYFIVRSGSRFHPPRLEYYDNEKKFRGGLPPKRTIDLSKCFSVNKRVDSKHKYGIVIYTKEDSFSILAESDEDHDDWFNEILEAFKEGICDTIQANHHYEYVWPVTVQHKGLGAARSLSGHYRLCLSFETVSLVKLNSILPEVEFQLRLIRRCGHSYGMFSMEVGRSSVTGEGKLWMAVEDTAMAQTMHDAILNAMKNPSMPRVRNDSSGTSSHPISVPAPAHEPPRVRTTSMGSPCRPQVTMEKTRPKSLFAQPTSASQSRSPGTPASLQFGTSPHSTVDYTDDDRLRSNSMESHGSRNGAGSGQSCDVSDGSPIDHLSSSHQAVRAVTPEAEQSEYVPMAPSNSSSVESSRERLNSVGSVGNTTPAPETYMDMAPTSMTSPLSHNTSLPTSMTSPVSHNISLPEQADTYLDMSPLASDTSAGENGSYAFMGAFNRGTKSAPSSVISGPPTHKSGPGSHKSAPGSYKGGPGSYKSGPGSHKSGPSSVKSISSVEGRDDGYIDMEPGSDTLSPSIDLKSPGYLSMSVGQSTKLSNMGDMRPDKVYSYLSDDSFSGETPHIRTYSVGSKSSMSKPTLTYQAYQESVAKQGKLCNNKSSSAPHLIPPKGRIPTETPSPVQTYVTSPPSAMSKSYKSDDSDSFMELDFCRPRTASDSYSYRRRAGSFGQTQTQHNNTSYQHFRERASSHGHTSKPVLLKRISSESVRTTSQELLKKTSMDSLHQCSRESLKSSQESLRKAVLDSRQRGSFQMDYMEMSPDKHKDVSRKKHVYLTNKKQSKTEEGKEYFDMTVGSPTQSFMHGMDSSGHSVTPTSPVTVKLTAPDTYMEMVPGQMPEVIVNNREHNQENVNKLSVGGHHGGAQKREVNPYMNISYDRDGQEGCGPPHQTSGGGSHARQASSPALLESQHRSNESNSKKSLQADIASHSHQHIASRSTTGSKSPIPRSPLAGEEAEAHLKFPPGEVKVKKKAEEKNHQSNNGSYYSQKRNSKLSPKSPDVLREESDSSYMSFSSDGSLSDSKNSDVWVPRNSQRMRHSHRKSETVQEESDGGYISFSPINVQGDSEGYSSKESKPQTTSNRKYHPKFDYRKDAQKSKKTSTASSKLNKIEDSYMSFAPSIVVEGQSAKDTLESKSEKLSFEAGVVSSNISSGCKTDSSLKEEESAYLEFSPAGASSDKESSKKNANSQMPGQETGKMAAKKKQSAEHAARRARKVSSSSKPKLSQAETLPQEPGAAESSLTSDYSNMSLPAGNNDSVTTRPLFDPSKTPKSAWSPGQPERGILRSPRFASQKNGNEILDNKSQYGIGTGTPAVVSATKKSERSRKISCESLKGSVLDPNLSGKLPKRGSTPNIPCYTDKGGPCSVVDGSSMLPGDRHSYSEPSSSDLAVSGVLTPNSGSNSRHSSRTSLNSIVGKETLNYASLDLGSSDNVTGAGEGGITFLSASSSQSAVGRALHPSSHQETEDAPPFYAQIDFKKCEELKNSKR